MNDESHIREQLTPLQRAVLALQEARAELESLKSAQREPIAVIGMGCRFPGGADDPEGFWRLLRHGIDAITEVPSNRWNMDSIYHPDPDVPGKMYTRYGGFLASVDEFDAQFFGIAPREAIRMDPQHRLLLEVTWEALEHAGQAPDKLSGSQTGVFMGISTNDYGALRGGDLADIDPYTGTGNAFSVAAGRLSYLLGLQGPNVPVDTACSSSLVAVHLACQSLRGGECNLALAGGVNLILTPDTTMYFCRLRAMAPDGRCKTFDAGADGYVRSEGCGVVVLKRLCDARRDGDPILAVIRGSAINHDGRSNGLTAPNGTAQEAVIRAALQNAGVAPAQVGYVEAHGTGTPLGDTIELQALAAALRAERAANQRLIVGSVKTNVGHLEAAAGVAGLIKVVLALQHGEIPPHLHFKEPNPFLPWEELRLEIPSQRTPWPLTYGERIGSVSSFGISGTNAHVVLGEAPGLTAQQAPDPTPGAERSYLLPLSARHPAALQGLAQAYHDLLQRPMAAADSRSTASLYDICYTASVRRSHYEHRLALLGGSQAELDARLAAFLQGEAAAGLFAGIAQPGQRRRLAFVFPGQGGQWVGMGQQLLASEPVFRAMIEQCDQAMRPYVDWSLLEGLTGGSEPLRLDYIDIVQPAIFAIQMGLAALWRAWGVVPDAVVGHSMGEVAAACVAGALSLDDAARIICRRSQLLRQLSGRGAMAVVELSLAEAHAMLAGYEQYLAVAVSNSPRSTVISGDATALDTLLDQLQRQDIFCRRVNVDVASHSPQMDALRAELSQALHGIRPQAATVPIYSTVTGKIGDGPEFDGAYWVQNLRQPVLFADAVQQLAADGHDIFLELSPHPILLPAIEDNLRQLGRSGSVLPSLRREEPERDVMLGTLGALYTLGQPVAWEQLYPAGVPTVSLPTYPWQRERFWVAEPPPRGARARVHPMTHHALPMHPFLDDHMESAAQPGTHLWEIDLSSDRFPYLADHRLESLVVLPAAAYAELMLAAATAAFGDRPFVLEDLTFKNMLILQEHEAQTIQISLTEDMPGSASLQISSRPAAALDNHATLEQRATWKQHAIGMMRLSDIGAGPAAVVDRASHAAAMKDRQEIMARCSEFITGMAYYQGLAAQGLKYGPSFAGITEIWRQPGEALARLQLPESVTAQASRYLVHPALLDMCFQVMGAALPGWQASGSDLQVADAPYLPVSLGSLQLRQRPGDELWVHACLIQEVMGDAKAVEGNLWLCDKDGQIVLEACKFRVQRLDVATPPQAPLDDWLYAVEWHPQPRRQGEPGPNPTDRAGSWLIFDDAVGSGQLIAARLEERGATCVMVTPGEAYKQLAPQRYQLNPAHPEEFSQLLHDALEGSRPPCRGVVHLWSLAAPGEPTLDTLDTAQELGCASVLFLVQALIRKGWRNAPGLWLVTAGCQAVGTEAPPTAIAQAPLWGLGRTIALEHPEFACTCIDLSPTAAAELHSLGDELWSDDSEAQIALRGDVRYVARLVPGGLDGGVGPALEGRSASVPTEDQPFRLEIDAPGVLDHLTLRATRRRSPAVGEVEIQVCAAGLNFLDVLAAMGLRPDLPEGLIQLGSECSGTIIAISDGVEGLQVGDAVIAIAACSFGTSVMTPAAFVVPMPAQLSFAEAATIPIAFLTAYYALHHVGRLQPGERVLIHSAAGGVGLAAVQVARWLGAEIFASAGSEEKRAFLRSLGLQHTMDSRSLAFADEVLERTAGRGVDVVLNSLTGEAIPRSLSVLAPYGRFLEIGKKDVYQNHRLGLWPFHKNLSYSMIDLARLLQERPAFCARLLREVLQHVVAGTFTALPRQVFPIAHAGDAFRHMAQARHIGKIILSLQDRTAIKIAPASEPELQIHPDATYLITGGLGGLGLSVARWMVQQGARHLVLVGRSAASAVAAQAVDDLQGAGAQVLVAQADVTQSDAIGAVLANITQAMPPLRGVIHAAGVLDDSTLLQLDVERLRRVMAPKSDGAWNLHTLTKGQALDFFVLYSSGSALLGTPGQGNYAAANAFMDALAHYRRAQGLPAMSINWGPFSDVGLVAGPGWRERLANRGMGSITPAQGVEVLGRLLRYRSPQIAVLPLNLRQLRQVYPRSAHNPFFSILMQGEGKASGAREGDSRLRQELLAAELPARLLLLEHHIRQQIAQVVRLEAARIGTRTPLSSLGLDSLMGLELRNRLEASLGLTLPATLTWKYPTVEVLATYLSEELGLPRQLETDAPEAPLPEQPTATTIFDRIAQLSDDDVERLFAEKIAKKGR